MAVETLNQDTLAMLGYMAIFMTVLFIVSLLFYVYSSLTIMFTAKKLKTPNAWLAWIPIANIWLLKEMARAPAWSFIVVLLIPFVNAGFMVWWYWRICVRRNVPRWFSILMIVPIVNLVVMGILAWSD